MTNALKLSMIREFLTAASAALIAYGVGSPDLWQEVAGGVVAAIMLAWGIKANTGRAQWASLLRKTLSAVGGLMITFGTITPDKANVLVGVVSSFIALAWSVYKQTPTAVEDGKPDPTDTPT